MRVHIKPTYQIQRIHLLMNQLKAITEQDRQLFQQRPNEKSWCGAEVIKHMIVAQEAYAQKVENTLSKLNLVDEDVDSLPTRAIPSFLIKRFPPLEGKIRFKMKTTKQFKPMLEPDKLNASKVDDLLQQMQHSLTQLLHWVEQTRKKDVRTVRFNSAIGPIVKFNTSEACEFILCHNERHFQQIQNVFSALKE